MSNIIRDQQRRRLGLPDPNEVPFPEQAKNWMERRTSADIEPRPVPAIPGQVGGGPPDDYDSVSMGGDPADAYNSPDLHVALDDVMAGMFPQQPDTVPEDPPMAPPDLPTHYDPAEEAKRKQSYWANSPAARDFEHRYPKNEYSDVSPRPKGPFPTQQAAAQSLQPVGSPPPAPEPRRIATREEADEMMKEAGAVTLPPPRKWIDSTGRHGMVGRAMGVQGGDLMIRSQETGNIVYVAIDKLSPQDQQHVAAMFPNAQVASRPAAPAAAPVAQPAAKPAPVAAAAPPQNAGPETLVAGPGEETEPGAAAAADARAKPVPMPGTPENRERFLARVWPQIGHAAESHGLYLEDRQTEEGDRIPGLRSIYNNAAQQGGHNAGMRAVQMALMAVRTEMRAAKEQEKQQRIAEFKQARMMGVAPQAYQQYRSMSFANNEQRLAFLTMMHSQNPYMGWGNLAAMEMRNQAGAQQAGVLNQGQPLGADREAANLERITASPVGPATIPALNNHYRMTPEGKANPGGAKQHAKDMAQPMYEKYHGAKKLTPQQDAFVRNYLRLFNSYQEFRSHLGLEDTPANRKWWEEKTQRDAETIYERSMETLGPALAQGTGLVGAGVSWLYDKAKQALAPKPGEGQVAKDTPPRKPR